MPTFIFGPEVDAFERAAAPLTGCQHAIGCASDCDALALALLAREIGSDDEVMTTRFTFIASVGSIERVGAKPVFADIDPITFKRAVVATVAEFVGAQRRPTHV